MSAVTGDAELTPQQRLRAAAQRAWPALYGAGVGRPTADQVLGLLEVAVAETVLRIVEWEGRP